MSQKTFIGFGLFVGSLIGGYVPVLWGAGVLSYSSLLGSGIGAGVGIYLAYKFTSS